MQQLFDKLDQQDWLDRVGDRLQRSVEGVYRASGGAGQKVKNFLHGTWSGHPLHPVFTDVAIGAWTMAYVLDLLEIFGKDQKSRGAADAAIGLGLIAGMGAALSGLTDWQHTSGGARRTGVAHALLNSAAMSSYATSMILRSRHARPLGFAMGFVGFNIALLSAYLGGHMVYGQRIGVSRVDGIHLPTDFVRILRESELQERAPRGVDVQGVPVLLVRQGSSIYALVGICSHLGGPLPEGKLVDESIICPWHASRFALDDGRVLNGPATFPQPRLETRIVDGYVEVRGAN